MTAIEIHFLTILQEHRGLANAISVPQMAAEAMGFSGDFEAAMQTLNETQFDLLADGDERLDLFTTWIESKPDNWSESVKNCDILAGLRGAYQGQDRDFPFKSPDAVGRWIGRHKDLIRHKTGVIAKPERTTMTRGWLFEKTKCHRDMPENHNKNHSLRNSDAMTLQSLNKCQTQKAKVDL